MFYLCNRDKIDFGKWFFCVVFGKDLLDVVFNFCLRNKKVIEVFIKEIDDYLEKLKMLVERKEFEIE